MAKHRKRGSKKVNSASRLPRYRLSSIFSNRWLLLITIFICLGGPFIFVLIRDSTPATIETVTAKVNRMWVEQRDSETGGSVIRRVQLQREGETLNCTVSPVYNRLWFQLEIERTYVFTVTHTVRGCYISEATVVDQPGETLLTVASVSRDAVERYNFATGQWSSISFLDGACSFLK